MIDTQIPSFRVKVNDDRTITFQEVVQYWSSEDKPEQDWVDVPVVDSRGNTAGFKLAADSSGFSALVGRKRLPMV